MFWLKQTKGFAGSLFCYSRVPGPREWRAPVNSYPHLLIQPHGFHEFSSAGGKTQSDASLSMDQLEFALMCVACNLRHRSIAIWFRSRANRRRPVCRIPGRYTYKSPAPISTAITGDTQVNVVHTLASGHCSRCKFAYIHQLTTSNTACCRSTRGPDIER